MSADDEAPTSAQLRNTRDRLDVMDARYAAVVAERDQLRATVVRADAAGLRLVEEARAAQAALDAAHTSNHELAALYESATADVGRLTEDTQYLRALLDESLEQRAELRERLELAGTHRVDWARTNTVGDCWRCGVPIMRGMAVQAQPGTTKGGWGHCACPDRCERCEQLIQPGESHEHMPGSGGLVIHTTCKES